MILPPLLFLLRKYIPPFYTPLVFIHLTTTLIVEETGSPYTPRKRVIQNFNTLNQPENLLHEP